MRKTFIYTLFGLAMTAVAEIYPAGELLPMMIPAKSKRHSPAGGLHPHHVSRGDGFIPVTPATKGLPVIGSDKHSGKRRFLRKDEVVVPASLQNTASKRQLSCGDANYRVCTDQNLCCPIDGLCCKSGDCCDPGYRCCTVGSCCPETHNCVTVGGINGCCPIGRICTSNSQTCTDPGYVHCPNEAFCCKPGSTCSRDASGKASCDSGTSNQTTTTTTQQPATTTTTPAATTTTTTPAANPTTTTTTTPQPTTTTTPQAKLQDTTTSSDQQVPTTMSVANSVTPLGGGPPTTMYNPTAITTLPKAASASTPAASDVDIPIVGSSGAMAVTAGIGYSVLVTAVSFALGHLVVMA